jgi:hypothetical protein
MRSDMWWAVSGLFGILGIVVQFAGFVKRIKKEEDLKERHRPGTIVYRADSR